VSPEGKVCDRTSASRVPPSVAGWIMMVMTMVMTTRGQR